MRVHLCCLLVAWLTARPVALAQGDAPDGKEVVSRSSDALIGDDEAWSDPGFRLWISFGYNYAANVDPSPPIHLFSSTVSAGWRFNERLALMGALRYGAALDGFSGVRWTGTLEPVLYLAGNLALSAGVGFAGLFGDRSNAGPYPYAEHLDDPDRIDVTPRVDAAELPPFAHCDGDGLVVLARGIYFFIIGDTFSTGPMLTLDTQWTNCRDRNFEQLVPLEERDRVPTQWWGHFSVDVSWVAAWR